MQIGELAERTGVSRRMLRHYEQRGLLDARRVTNGWRDYDDAAADRVRMIADMIDSGLTLDGVKQLLPCLDNENPSECAHPDLPLQTYRERLDVVAGGLRRVSNEHKVLARRVQSLEDDPATQR